MPPQIFSDATTFEQQIVHLLVSLGYGCLRRIEGEDGMPSFYAERETELGTDSIYLALDFWRDEVVGRHQVEQVVGRMAVEPARRLVVITTGRFDQPAREYARRASVTLIHGDQIAALFQQVESGAGVTTAFAAAAAAPTTAEPPPPNLGGVTAPAAPATTTPPADDTGTTSAPASATETPVTEPPGPPSRARPPERARRRRSRATQQEARRREQLYTLGVFALIFLVVAIVTTVVLVLAERRDQPGERVMAPGVEVRVEPVGIGNVVRVAGRVEPNQELVLYQNGLFVDRTIAGQQGDFVFPFVPLTLKGSNTLTLHEVTPEGRQGDLLWQRSGLAAPFR